MILFDDSRRFVVYIQKISSYAGAGFCKNALSGEYGGAHGNNDDLAAADSLKKEIKSMKPVSFKEELVEDISANFARVTYETFRRVG